MRTAQEAALGERGIDKIKKIFEDELNEWEKKDLYKWIIDKLKIEDKADLDRILLSFSTTQILDCLDQDDIEEYVETNFT